jgi:hypothetical protein
MALLDYVELAIAKCFPIASPNPHNKKLFRKGLAFASVPEPTIDVECAEVGPSGSTMLVEQTQVGTSRFPSLTWKTNLQGIKEYILVSEDPDGPFPTPIVHGIYYNIPAEKAGVDNDDFTAKSGNELQGGFKYGKNLRGTIYSGPKPLLTHGPHRYESVLLFSFFPVTITSAELVRICRLFR